MEVSQYLEKKNFRLPLWIPGIAYNSMVMPGALFTNMV